MKALLVGETNPYGGDPEFALYPAPHGCAGWRLCHKVLGVDPEVYMDEYVRVNLCAGKWSMKEARKRVDKLLVEHEKKPIPFVLLGAKVAEAFRVALPYIHDVQPFNMITKRPWVRWMSPTQRTQCLSKLAHTFTFIRLPHPSGRCTVWNEPGAYERAREVMRSVGAL